MIFVEGTSLKPFTHIKWDKDDSIELYTNTLIKKLLKGRISQVKRWRDEYLTLPLPWLEEPDTYILMNFFSEFYEYSGAHYKLQVQDIVNCVYKYKIHIVDVKEDRTYTFTIKNGDVYFNNEIIAETPDELVNYIQGDI